jgi:hypothetical protein
VADTTYHVGEEVRHARFGVGVVTKGGSGRVEIRFEGHGTKQFVPEIVPLAKTGKANPEFASSRNNGNTDDIEAYRGGALHASPSEEVRERIQTFIGLGDKQGWSPYDDTDDEDYDYAWTPELLAIKAEYEQEEALAGLFAAGHKNGHSNSKRPKGYADWNPHRKTRILISQVQEVLREYRAQLPLTARRIFYRLVGAYGYAKDERAYERLTNILVRARRSKMIPFEYIRDDGASVMESEHYENKEQFYRRIREMGEDFTRDKLARQGLDVRIYCEAAGMMPQISNVSDDYSVPVYSCSGFDSLTAKYDLFKDIARAHTYKGRRTVVLHLGDYDPSGESIFDAIAEDVHAFLSDAIPHKRPEEIAMFDRVALTRDMVAQYSLPTAPPKASDSRTRRWAGGQTCQLEALPPDTLANIIRGRIENLLSEEILEQDRTEELEERQIIAKALPAPGTD